MAPPDRLPGGRLTRRNIEVSMGKYWKKAAIASAIVSFVLAMIEEAT
jgi:hypothetical protein